MNILKQGKFITDPGYQCRTFDHPWNQGHDFNEKKIELPDRGGILTFVKKFKPASRVVSATLRATALGIFDLFFNGQRVGTETENGTVYDELKPGWTDYRSRVFCFTYDITGLTAEENVLVAEVSTGWWAGRISFGFYGFRAPAFAGEIELVYEDGSTELFASGEDWLVTLDGQVRTADIWDGELIDACRPCLHLTPDAAEYRNAVLFQDATCDIVPPVGEPVRVTASLNRKPMSAVIWNGTEDDGSEFGKIHIISKKVGSGCFQNHLHAGDGLILDMEQNMVGRPHLRIRAKRGTRIECFFAEFLNDSGESSRGNDGPKGSLYIKNYRSALARMVYIASGEGTEDVFPAHVFYGFRYLELTGDADFEVISVTGEVLRSDLRETSSFTCSNQEVNKLFSNILWGQRGNYLSVPTDCPQRDERLGWTGDTQIFCGAGSYNADVRGFFHKWLGDARDSQKDEEGAYCDVIPRVFKGTNNGNAAWGDAGLIVPYRLYLMYHDTDILDEHYASMESYMDYLSRFGMNGPNTAYGDWLNYDVTDKRYIAVAYYAYDAELMTLFSEVLAKKHASEDTASFYTERAAYYRSLREKIGAHFLKTYYPDGELVFQTQTAYLLALKFGLIPEADRQKNIDALKEKIISNNYTLSTGFVGTGILNQTLQECGLSNLAYSLLLQTADPSWLYSVRQGATTIWERWNSYTVATGFGNVGMNSFNHYAYGAVAEWMMGGMAGILPDKDAPGFGHFLLYPTPDLRSDDEIPPSQERITSLSASYDSISGKISSAWTYSGGSFTYRFTIPEGTTAEVGIPLAGLDDDALLLSGVRRSFRELGAEKKGDRLVFTLPAGGYTVQ